MSKKYPPAFSRVIVTFLDGEVKEYNISAGPRIGGHIVWEAGDTGILNLFNDDTSYAIPLTHIREWLIEPMGEIK